jgi:RNA polymerase sigma factor (sigma-70 family)
MPRRSSGVGPQTQVNPLKPDATRWFTEVVNPHGPALRAYLCAQFPLVADVDDLVQESLLRVLSAREKGQVTSAKALLFAIGRNLALDAMRRRRLIAFEPISEIDRFSSFTDNIDVVESVSHQQELLLLRQAISLLPQLCQQVLTLRTAYGLSQRQIAERLVISENTVEKQLSKGLRLCVAFFAERGMP